MTRSISEEAILEYGKFPDAIRNDECFVAFRAELERLQGKIRKQILIKKGYLTGNKGSRSFLIFDQVFLSFIKSIDSNLIHRN